MCGRSLCLVKGRKIGLRRRYALRESASAAEGGMEWGREELLAEGVRVRTGEFTPETGGRGTLRDGTAHCMEPRGWETGCWDSLGGCAGSGGGGGSCLAATASAGFPGSGGF